MDIDNLRSDLTELISHRLFWARAGVIDSTMLKNPEEAHHRAFRDDFIFKAQVEMIVADMIVVIRSYL